ncbi:MAG: hypothetical protein IJK31_10405 [Ruminococcus sp.]|nr:hypothetical protein [Ruminococcus sp.]
MFDNIVKRTVSLLFAAALTTSNITSVYAEELATEPTFAVTEASTEEMTTEAATQAEAELTYQIFELYPDEYADEKVVTLDGLMPEGAEASAVDVSDEHSGIAAYDITITNGEDEYQPDAENPIKVEIVDPVITENITLWHICDDGSREQIFDFTAENGRISFFATGFSVYEIVDNVINEQSDFLTKLAERGEEGFYAFVTFDPPNGSRGPYYFSGSTMVIDDQGGRQGFKLTAKNDKASAVKLYFKKAEGDNNFYIYIMDGSTKKYLYSDVTGTYGNNGGSNTDRAALYLVDNESDATVFKTDAITSTGQVKIYATLVRPNNTTEKYYWVADNKNNIQSVVAYKNSSDANLAWLTIFEGEDDPYKLDGKSYALMNYQGGTLGEGLMANDDNSVEMLSWVVRREGGGTDTLYVTEDIDATVWTFQNAAADRYFIYTMINGSPKYLNISNSSITVSDTPQEITVQPNNAGRIKLTADNGKSLTYDNNSDSFTAGTGSYLAFVQKSTIENEDQVTYSAKKVSVSEVQNGDSVIVYTRVWNTEKERYDFYAIDCDGSLVPCFERGDDIMWVGGRINTMMWDFSEYYWENTTTPNNYYDLYNAYSGLYIAPDYTQGTILDSAPIGLNLPGRKGGEYYTDLLAWDDPSYAYAGVKPLIDENHDGNIEDSRIVASRRSDAETFYFATVVDPDKNLTVVDTIDNNDYGIKMKMIDYPAKAKNTSLYPDNNAHNIQDVVLDDYTSSHNRSALPGLLATNLETATDENGNTIYTYPKNAAGDHSLEELFGDSATTVNHLFVESIYEASGYFEYDSCQNFASLNRSTGDFTVYKELGTTDGDGAYTLKHGQFLPYDTITAGNYSTRNPSNLYSALADRNDPNAGVLPEDDPRKYERLLTVGTSPNYYNGMELEASFVQTPSGKDNWNHDIIFEFTGDDDFWLYVDGELVIDLGGIHSALGGSINFATGKVVINGHETTLKQVFIDNYTSRNPDATQEEIDEFLESKHFGKLSDGTFENIFDDYSSHTMKIFYMERGAGASNLHMRFNLSYVTPGHVILTKQISGTEDLDFELLEYPYQIWYKDQTNGEPKLLTNDDQHINVTYQNSTKKVDYLESYTPPGSETSYPSVFFINPQRSAEIHFPANTIEYQIIECGISNDVYDKVSVNGTAVSMDSIGQSGRSTIESGWIQVSERTNVTFDNHVDPASLRTLSFQKKLFNDTYDIDYKNSLPKEQQKAYEDSHKILPEDDQTTFSFRLYLSDGVTGDLQLTNMYEYNVTDPDGYYCRWDASQQKFISTNLLKSELDDEISAINSNTELTDQQKIIQRKVITDSIPTFESSMNGQISKIPAWYTVHVPHIPVGAKFKVEERDSSAERPIGYDCVEYERVEGSYITDTSESENIGWIKKEDSPQMNVINQRGFEIEAIKSWTDKDFTKYHDSIYMALYVYDRNNDGEYVDPQLVPGFIKQIKGGSIDSADQTSARFFMKSLGTDSFGNARTLDNYAVYEVQLVNPTVDAYGNVTSYDSLTPLFDGNKTTISATSKTNITDQISYTVNYTRGEVTSSSGLLDNTRTDTVTNTRSGGVVISLYDMKERKELPLANGKFKLTRGDTDIGLFTSDANGKITILYDYMFDTDYVLTEIASPTHYIGLPNPVTFQIHNTGTDEEPIYSVTLSGNDSHWEDWDLPALPDDEFNAYINVYNKNFTLQALKVDSRDASLKLEGVHFALYRGVNGVGGIVKDYQPLDGYEDLVTDANGVIPRINQSLPPGKYFLEETQSQGGYRKAEDVVFTIRNDDIEIYGITATDANGVITNQDGVTLTKNNGDEYACTISIPNTLEQTDYFFDIEKIIFVDKNIHSSDTEQRFIFKVDRFNEGTTDFTSVPTDTFYVTLSCDQQMVYTDDSSITVGGEDYNYSFYHSDDNDAYPYSSFSGSGDNVVITKTYQNNGRTETYPMPARILNGRQTVHVQKDGIYRVTEVTEWSGTDYDFWTGSNVYKGYGTPIAQGQDDGSVIFSVTDVRANQFVNDTDNLSGQYRPTASFTNSETEFAYLSSQAWAKNIIRFQ